MSRPPDGPGCGRAATRSVAPRERLSVRVFLGPTLPVDEARAILDADYRPPIVSGDLPLAMAAGVDVVVIIDGAYIQSTTASVTQIGLCLQSGMRVYGAASAGALRAVECAPLGMIGVGAVYELFASGFEDEDELAVAFDGDTGRALSVPMVNVRHACRRAVELGVVPVATGATIADVANSIYFAERSYRGIRHECADRVASEELDAFDRFRTEHAHELDVKADDARRCLRAVAHFVAAREAAMAAGRADDTCAAVDEMRRSTVHEPSMAEVLGGLCRSGDPQLVVDLVEVARRRPDDQRFVRRLDVALGEAALRVRLHPDARRAWSSVKALLGDLDAARELAGGGDRARTGARRALGTADHGRPHAEA